MFETTNQIDLINLLVLSFSVQNHKIRIKNMEDQGSSRGKW